jgi:tRNA (adenine57-N1/adenine58-N1)-methyltransferase catalytic subunit
MASITSSTSSFLTPGPAAQEHNLASLHIRRDQSLSVLLKSTASSAEDEGYAEGVVTNTRFGSFPHSTIIGTPWGSQIRASKVDTGSRGRQEPNKKRKASQMNGAQVDESAASEAVAASSGFLHVLQPTPESWTYSLPHRTQVVYTPDYSYILHRIRAKPGSTIIEAGSGSGSFTHAAARAVFSGYLDAPPVNGQPSGNSSTHGKVFSYEFHSERYQKVSQEMREHRLSSIVTNTHRDVYNGGFLLSDSSEDQTPVSPAANSIFLDLPAPWSTLPHLTRASPSALDPNSAVYICTFSPCIEQAQKTVSCLRRYNWLEIEMVEVQNKRIDVRRDFVGFDYDGMRGVTAVAATVDDAVMKLKEVEQRAKDFHAGSSDLSATKKQTRLANSHQDAQKVLFREGTLVHRSEPDLKTHTSYLVFAVLPREWTEEDEDEAMGKWAKSVKLEAEVPKSQRQLKKEAKLRRKIRDRKDGDNNAEDIVNQEDIKQDV